MRIKVYIGVVVCFFTTYVYADKAVSLESHNWCPTVKEQLQKLIADNAHQGKKVVFDFDNTVICRDIGEAMFATMAMDKKLRLHSDLHPSFTFAGKKYGAVHSTDVVCGDSPNDFPMLNWGENRLFITRLEKMDYQQKLIEQINKSLPGKWLLQPTLCKKSPGFVSTRSMLELRLKSKQYMDVVDLLEKSQYLRGFSAK